MQEYRPSEVQRALSNRFSIVEPIRAGGQGAVYRAMRTALPDGSPTHDHVALKIYGVAGQEERVDREVAVMQRIRHASLASLVEAGELSLAGAKLRYVAWGYVEGAALDERLSRGPLEPNTVAVVGRDVAAALAELWTHRIVHRDIKPKNVMLRRGEREAVLIDLGIARHLDEASLTPHGMTCGTIGYMSPEQFRGERHLTCKSDVFSLGVVLQESLAAAHPTGRDQVRLVTTPPRTAEIAPTCPTALANIVDSMLSLRPAFRPDPCTLVKSFENLIALL
ncbi:MAG TPA: serine/threonine-protein kinase [Longimicrobiales bacterium]